MTAKSNDLSLATFTEKGMTMDKMPKRKKYREDPFIVHEILKARFNFSVNEALSREIEELDNGNEEIWD
ncbi:MAG: hypothetical protein RLZZ292_3603 [Bacteroidota bacterium]|jgi:hypothetical protein